MPAVARLASRGSMGIRRRPDFGGYGIDDVLVLFRLERAGGVDDAAAGGEAAGGSAEDGALAGGVAGEVFWAEAMADFGIAGECAGAAAGNVAEDEIEVCGFGCGCVWGVGDCGADVGGVGVVAEAGCGVRRGGGG